MITISYALENYSFQELACEHTTPEPILSAIERIAQELSTESAEHAYAYLHDKLDYRKLIAIDYQQYANFGRFFLLKDGENGPYIGFLLCFDDLSPTPDTHDETDHRKPNASNFPIDYCKQFLSHDAPFLTDLYHIRQFAYVFQIGILPEYQHSGAGRKLIQAFEGWYKDKRGTHILAGSIHERQYRIFKLMRRLRAKDGRYIFLNHHFDHQKPDQHWFRIVKLLNPHSFFHKINPFLLPLTYNTVIPVQLNQAVSMVNDIIKEMGAQILWSSFFNDSNLLKQRYGMDEDNHGFFESILRSDSLQEYEQVLKMLRAITKYLEQKDHPSSSIASLTDSFKTKSYEVFFFDSDSNNHDLSDFNRPVKFSLSEPAKLRTKFLTHSLVQKRTDMRPMSTKEKGDLYKTLNNIAKINQNIEPRYSQHLYEWQAWRRLLLITDEEEAILLEGIRILNKKKHLEKSTKEVDYAYENYQSLFKTIKQRRIAPEGKYEQWDAYLDLHHKLYAIDKMVLDKPEDYWWCHAMIPINYSGGSNVVGVMFTFRCRKLSQDHQDYQTRMGRLASLISSALSKNMLNILMKLQQRATNEAANRYAIAAITSRNLAHSYGSHILTRLDKEAGMLALINEHFSGNFPAEMARFLGYLRTRTNLLADISTSEPVSTTSRWLRDEVLKSFNDQAIVKRYISNSTLRKISVNYRVNGQLKQPDVEVQIPNGDLGVSAFCMIIENIVRNTAKYEDTSGMKALEVSVDVIGQDERGHILEIYDHIPRPKHRLDELVKRINEQYITKVVIDSSNNIRGSGWGILEMRAAASYLRKKVPGVVIGEESNRKIPFIQAKPKVLPGSSPAQYALAYEIYLKKPRSILLIDLQKKLVPALAQIASQRSDMKLINALDLKRTAKAIHPHTFAVCLHDTDRKDVEQRHKRFPLRWVLLDQAADRDRLNNWIRDTGHRDELMCWLWGKWLERYCRNKGLDYAQLCLRVPVLSGEPNVRMPSVDPAQLLLYDDHGQWREDNPNFSIAQMGFYQVHRSTDPLGMVLYNTVRLSPIQQELLKYELLETAITEIILIDERLQEEALQRVVRNQQDLFEVLSLMKVYIPNPQTDGPDLLGKPKLEELELWLKELLTSRKIDFVVLHLGLLESWVDTEIQPIIAWLERCVLGVNKRPEIVLCSGRGKPQGFPGHLIYQPFDSIAKHVLEDTPSKYHLVKTLFSSRTRMGI